VTDRVGIIGLGIMGRPMARNLMKAGFSLTAWNRSRPGIDELVKAGATEGRGASSRRRTRVWCTWT
jgi:3-hydroxyisobutyrate dehydrogenase-like beta-hydroxyacid dehydrogenase